MSDCSRRKFIKGALTLGTASLVGCSKANNVGDNASGSAEPPEPPASSAPPNTLKEKVPTAVLGKTGEKVPILAHGGGYAFNNLMLARAFELGINYFDTADCYVGGQGEVVLGKLLEKTGKRKESFIVSKAHPKQPAEMLQLIDQRLENLRTDYLDLFFIHQLGDGEYPRECVEWPRSKELKEVAEQLKKQKKVKFFGFSCHAGILPQALENAAEGGFIDAIMFRYNFRTDSDELNRAIDKAKKANIGLIAMKTQGGRVLHHEKLADLTNKGFNQFQATLKAVWADGRIDSICSNMPSIQITQENAMAAVQNQISKAEREMLEEYKQATNHLVCNGCDHICSPHVSEPVQIGATLRYLMYHDNYGERERARNLFSQLPTETREAILRADYRAAEAACPFKLQISEMMHRAAHKLA